MDQITQLSLAAMPSESFFQLLIFVIALAVLFLLLRFVLRLVTRVVAIGCTFFLALGLLWLVVNYFS